jgi:uncharacterized protein YecE (DUF72 family)
VPGVVVAEEHQTEHGQDDAHGHPSGDLQDAAEAAGYGRGHQDDHDQQDHGYTLPVVEIYVGTSGWQYRDWRGPLYPEGLPQRRWLEHFSRVFPIVEVNNTFYMLPKEETFSTWREGSAEGFTFVVKANRYITHIRRLRDARDAVRRFWERCRRLEEKLGPVLFQLPPNLQADPERLDRFIGELPRKMRSAFEFRHPSWDTDEVREILDRGGCALVLADRPGARVPDLVTGGWSYVRFHQGRPDGSDYRPEKLGRWAGRLVALPAQEVYVFFNNDPGGAAVRDAVTLTRYLRGRGASVRGPELP